ncbi:MAG: DNA-directed RNA polymerase subunit B [Desulfurococcales archaeon]|nr:DNA-directed RNA polymerase subunit B [Desulfurococcales archaeon]
MAQDIILTEEDRYLLASSMIEEFGLSKQHIESYNRFVTKTIYEIVEAYKVIKPYQRAPRRGAPAPEASPLSDTYIIINSVRLGRPQVRETDGTVHEINPMTCRLRNLTYSVPIYINATLYEKGAIKDSTDGEEIYIGDLPLMVKSAIDPIAHKTLKERIAMGEDKNDNGGYFIINGNERVIVAQEELAVNRILVSIGGGSFAASSKVTHSAKLTSISKGATSRIMIDRMANKTFQAVVTRIKGRVPVAILMKALGLTTDKEIMYAVSPDPEFQDELLPSLMEVSMVSTREEALDFIGNRVAGGQPSEIRRKIAEEVLDKYFLPHVGQTPQARLRKAVMIADMLRRIIELRLGKREPDDKDHYGNKRLRLAGDLIAEVFRGAMEAYVRHVSRELERMLSEGRKPRLKQLLTNTIITGELKKRLATGTWPNNRTGVSQALDRTNLIAALSHERRVISSLSRAQSHFEARDLHGTHWGRLCPFETPEGTNCGLVKNLALLSYISVGVEEDDAQLEGMLYDMGVLKVEDIIAKARDDDPKALEALSKYTRVFLNGVLVGYHPNGEALANEIRKLRRAGKIHHEVGVAYLEDGIIPEIYVNTDAGRLMRPLIVVENGKPKLTKKHIEMLRRGEIKFSDLVKMGVIEYLDPEEEENALVALWPQDLTKEHTHLELWIPGIFGVAASTIPFMEYNQSPRNTYQAAMAKQALGLHAVNLRLRSDSRAHLHHYTQKPLVQTRALDLIGYNDRPAGVNAVVAIMSYTGYNIEDALIFNKTSIDRGFARSTFFRLYTTVERKYSGGLEDEITIPQPGVIDYKQPHHYRHLGPDGIIAPEVRVKGGDVLIGKLSPPRFTADQQLVTRTPTYQARKRDTSVTMRPRESGIVDSVLLTETEEGYKLVKVRVRDLRIPEIGDKFSSRHGQKGVIGMMYPQYDLPYTEEGITPDIIINPHAFPSRMTLGQLIETIAGKVAAISGRYVDGTPFVGEKPDSLKMELMRAGYPGDASEIMYDGRTGIMMENPVVIGIVYYQKLHHMVSDKIHARSTGPVQMLTRQPTEGRAKKGGLRFGEMERDCLIGHGAAMVLRDRLLENSDAYTMYVCRKCGFISWYNAKKRAFECPIHGTDGDVVPVKVPYSFKLLLQELMSLMIRPRLIISDAGEVVKLEFSKVGNKEEEKT